MPNDRAAEKTKDTVQNPAGVPRRQNLIQCRQCSEQFVRRTMICPRCSRMNDRSPFILGVKVFAFVLFACVVTWVVRTASGHGDPPAEERVILPADAPQAPVSQPDLRF